MGGYIGSSVGNVANAAERKQTYSITTATTSLTGLAYTPTKVHVFHNGVRLVDSTDYTATNGTSITLTNAAQNGDEVVVISYPSFQTSDTVSAANGGTFAGNVAFSGTTTGLDVNGTDLILDADGDSKIEASTDDTITVHTAGSEAMRIDSAQNIAIGTTAPTTFSGFKTLHFKNGSGDAISLVESDGGVISQEISSDSTGVTLGSRSNHDLRITTNDTERMRIDNSGQVLIAKTTTAQTSDAGHAFIDDGRYFSVAGFSNNSQETLTVYSTGVGAFRFYVDYGGTIHATSTSISAISDQRLKENITDLDTGLDEVLALQPRRFDWINGDGENVAGFIAQEVETVLPDLIDNFKHTELSDAKGLKMGDMIPTLVKAIQELNAKVETLETQNTTQATQIADLITRVTALEAE